MPGVGDEVTACFLLLLIAALVLLAVCARGSSGGGGGGGGQGGAGAGARVPLLRPPTLASSCPICLQSTSRFPVETSCGHVFCCHCFLAYWRHESASEWRQEAVRCPVCRQAVSLLLPLFSEGEAARAEVDEYNGRFSSARGSLVQQLRELPTLLRHLSSDWFSLRTLVGVARLRLAVALAAAVAYVVSPLDLIPEALVGVVGLADDLLVLLLLALYLSLLYRQVLAARWRRSD